MSAMVKLLKELRATTKGTEKLNALKTRHDNEPIADAFKLCYDPGIVSNINKIPELEKTGISTFTESYGWFRALFYQLSNREITGNEARDNIKQFLEECDEDTQEIYSQILKGDLRCGVSVSTINKVWEGLIPKFEVQLAAKYDVDKDYGVSYFWASPKLDGIRCVWKDGQLWTRSGKPVIGFEHLEKELVELCAERNVDFVDGELYSHSIPFQTIQGFVVRNKNIVEEDKKKIKFNIFAVLNSKIEFEYTKEMIAVLNFIRFNKKYDHLTVVEYKAISNDFEAINELCEQYVDMGYEGIMLRHPENVYAWKRDNNLLKFKLFFEEDFEIIGTEFGTGKYKDVVGAFIVQGELDGKKIYSKVGSGFSDEERAEFSIRSDLLGKMVEVKYQGVTDKENAEGNYSLRFPVFMKLKEDR